MTEPSTHDTRGHPASDRLPDRVTPRAKNADRHSPSAMVLAVLTALVLLRTALYLLFEQVSFDSDQAIVGLMAKHLVEGRAFPLFFYGQTYMLGVEAWAAAPFVLLVGPTVLALRLSMLAWNIAFAVLLVEGLRRGAGLRPWVALVPALFFAAAPPSIAHQLITAQGGIIEPFVYVALLWFLRDRPLWFGAVLGLGFRNREFTMYAVPALLILQVASGGLGWARVRGWLLAMVTFFAVWEVVEALMPFADLSGPGTRGELPAVSAESQVTNLVDRFNWQPGELVERITRIGPELLAWFSGARQVGTSLPLPERNWLAWIAGTCALAALVRLLVLLVARPSAPAATSHLRRVASQIASAHFALYLLLVGTIAIVAFLAGRPILGGYARYAILGMLTPVGLVAALLALEPRPLVRRLAILATVAWASLGAVDHTRVLAAYVEDPPPNPFREIADRLVTRNVASARAGYWDAYKITFLAREQVRVASDDFIRIQEYHDVLPESADAVVRIRDRPCPNGELIGDLYLCGP